jgi:hypothetical protein
VSYCDLWPRLWRPWSVTSSLVLDLFHGKHYGAILGFLGLAPGSGTIGPWLSGFLFDRTKSYTLSFGLSMAVLCSPLCLHGWPAAGPCTGEQVSQSPELPSSARFGASRRTWGRLLTNVHRSRWRITRLGHVARTRARYRHKPSAPGFTMIGGDGGGALQCGAVGISSGACQQHDMAARHPPDMEPPIVRFGNL